MHIVVVTRHIARAAFLYGPVLRAMVDADTQIILVGANGTADSSVGGTDAPWLVREIAIRPFGHGHAALEWAVLAGDLVALVEERAIAHGAVDILMSFEHDLEKVVTMAARATQAKLVVVAADAMPRATFAQRARARWKPIVHGLRRVVPEDMQEDVKDQLREWQDELNTYRKMAMRVAQQSEPWQQIPASIRDVGGPAVERLGVVAKQLRQYSQSPMTHYLLSSAPEGWTADAGWTDFSCGVGVDIERFLVGGTGRSMADLQREGMHVGVWFDPYGPKEIQDRVLREAKIAVERHGDRTAQWVAMPALSTTRGWEKKMSRYLARVDVAIVPANDMYAAMQAAAAGCVVMTRAESLAASVFRDGESAVCVAAIDSVQIHMLLHRLRSVERRAAIQDAAQRRALRMFDCTVFVRCLARGIDERLEFGAQPLGTEERPGLRRHI